jgi:ligand-binding sensor domain-containing protein
MNCIPGFLRVIAPCEDESRCCLIEVALTLYEPFAFPRSNNYIWISKTGHLMRIVFIVSFFLLCSYQGFAQQTRQYTFKNFSVTNGLASNVVRRVMQDRDGYIWVATSNGLQRYDGTSFITFKSRPDDPSSLPSNNIVLLYQDKKKNVWVMGDNDKIGIFDTRAFKFREIPVAGQKSKLFIAQSFFELPGGELMLMKSDGGLIQYSEKDRQFIQRPDFIPQPRNWKRNWIYWDESMNKYWMTSDSGLIQYDPVTKHLNYRGHNIDNDPVIRACGKIVFTTRAFVDMKSNVSFVHWPPRTGGPTIFRYNRQYSKVDTVYIGYPGYHEIGYFMQQRNGRIWAYGMPFLAEWVDTNGKTTFEHIPNGYRNEHSIKFDNLLDIFEDKESNVWLGTDNGLYLFNPDAQIFNTYHIFRDGKPFEAPVQAMEELSDGRIFVGCWGGASVTCYDRNFNPLPLPSSFPKGEISTWDMAVNPKSGELWITMQAGNIVVYNPKTNKSRRLAPEVFGGSTIRQVDEDTSGNLWFGTHSGRVIKWDYRKSGNDPSKGYELILQTGLVKKIHYDYQGYIWIGTLENGLLKLDARTHKVVKTFTSQGKEGERLFMDSPGDMTYYNDSTLIVSAGCINIINTRTNKISFISTEHGLPSNTTESVERDKNGIIWVGMTNGLCRLNLEKKLITFYDRRDGIIDDKFEMAGVKELSDGRLAFYTEHSFMVFDPKRFGQQYMPPRPYITAFELGGNSLSLDSILKARKAILKYNNTSITINFSAMSYLQQQKTHYYYMMEGVDKDWIRTDRPVEVVYNYLAPGNYTFKVKSENADGITNDEIAVLPITVRAPIWKTWWFYSLIALLIISVLYLLDRERMNRIRSLQQVRRQIRLSLTHEVSNTLNNISVLSEIAKIKADKNIVQAKDFIDQINEKSRYMMEALEDTLWSIDPQNDSMKQTVLRIKELTEGIRIDHDVEIDLIVDNKVQSLELEMKQRHELFFFYKEAMKFIVEQAGCRQVFVNINKLRSKLYMEILSECGNNAANFEEKFTAAVDKRVMALKGSMDVTADSKSFSVVLYVYVK